MPDHDPAADSNGHTSNGAASNGASAYEAAGRDLLLDQEPASRVVENFLAELAGSAATELRGDLSAGITLSRDGQAATGATSDDVANRCDEVQYLDDEGPCLTAMRGRQVISIDDLVGERRFSRYRSRALSVGVRSSLSLPLDGGDRGAGALNLYSRQVRAFGSTEQAEARRFAEGASRALGLALRLARHVERNEQLRAEVTSKRVLDRALGVLMAQRRCDAEIALGLLRSTARARDVTLGTLVDEILSAFDRKPPPVR